MHKQYNTNEYRNHAVFTQLKEYTSFYEHLSTSMVNWIVGGTRAINFETYLFSSIQGTLESINAILAIGRINDAVALMRKYYDAIIIHTYASLYLQDKLPVQEIIVKKIDDWIAGAQKIPEYREMSEYIKASDRLKEVNEVFFAGNKYKEIRKRCNSHVHYNFFQYMFLNDNDVYNENRIEHLNMLSENLTDLFTMHFIYTCMVNEHYMSSSDYMDHLDVGSIPIEDSQYWVAPFVQETFSTVIKQYQPQLANILKDTTCMHLD